MFQTKKDMPFLKFPLGNLKKKKQEILAKNIIFPLQINQKVKIYALYQMVIIENF